MKNTSKIYRLNVSVRGTKRSRALDEGENYDMMIPTWIPNPEMDLYTLHDFVEHIVGVATLKSGDLVTRLWIESAELDDSVDLNSADSPYLQSNSPEIDWIFEHDVVQDVILNIINKSDLSPGELHETAQSVFEIGQYAFGWGNADPCDAIQEISLQLISAGYGVTQNGI